jgi:hypothetical protein
MKKKLASILKTELSASLPALAEILRSHGRGRDTVLAHITPAEADLLKSRGGRGSINPQTGLPEFDVIPETLTVTAPAYTPPAYIPPYTPPAPAPVAAPTPAAPAADANVTPETVTVTAPAYTAPAYTPTIPTAFQAPVDTTIPSIPTAAPAAATANVAATPETATVTGVRSYPAAAAYVPPLTAQDIAAPQVTIPQDQSKGWLENNASLIAAALGLGLPVASRFLTPSGAGGLTQGLANTTAQLQPVLAGATQALSAAQAGNLTPGNMQALQAAQAQVAQAEARGAVGSQQAAETISQTYANLLQSQYTQALSALSTVVPEIQNAYIAGYNAQSNVANNNQQFYATLAQFLGSGGIENLASTISSIA